MCVGVLGRHRGKTTNQIMTHEIFQCLILFLYANLFVNMSSWKIRHCRTRGRCGEESAAMKVFVDIPASNHRNSERNTLGTTIQQAPYALVPTISINLIIHFLAFVG